MRILVSYVSAGTGHQRAAESIYNYFRENCKDVDVEIRDALQGAPALYKNFYIYGYEFLIKHVLWFWKFCFWFSSRRFFKKINKILIFISKLVISNNFSRFLSGYDPDFFISTHFLPLEVSAYLKRRKKINSKIVAIVTDFGIHPFWINEGTDLYVVASAFTKELLVCEGVNKDSIKEFGIPVESKFFNKFDKDALSAKLGIKRSKFTALIISGSFGIGPIEKIIRLLHRDTQILVVCANNRKLYARLIKRRYENVKVYSFIDNVQELMSVSDIVITKPGGLSISELLVMEIPPVFISPIPGQESENIRILKKYGVGLSPNSLNELRDIVLDYKEHPDKLLSEREKIKAIKKPFAAREISSVICKGSVWPSN
jgi:processive 1,2-diacylglycerol beta-glucosyltransferase